MTSLVEVGNKERVLAVTPLGYAWESESWEEKLMTGFGLTHKRLPISKLISEWEMEKLPQ